VRSAQTVAMTRTTGTAVAVPPVVFLLGTQRSGSTWLANIFDASPEALLFMEPFAPAYGIFPEFPGASQFLDAPSPELTRLLKADMPARLVQYKSLFSDNSLYDPRAFRRERRLAELLRRFTRGPLYRRAIRFQLLNLNRLDAAFAPPTKRAPAKMWAIKELRLAGKIPLLRDAYPDASYVVIMRHPAATAHSILSWFRRSRLGELRADLETYLDDLAAQPAGEPYAPQIQRCRAGTPAHLISLYWRVSYEVMLAQLAGNDRTQLLAYEALASDPAATARRVYTAAGGNWSPEQEAYLAHSTTGASDPESPITTRRNSTTYYRAWTEKIDADVRRAVDDITGDSPLLEHFEPYYRD
jgi:hypothetical protein